jgi:hypothetical protein
VNKKQLKFTVLCSAPQRKLLEFVNKTTQIDWIFLFSRAVKNLEFANKTTQIDLILVSRAAKDFGICEQNNSN